MTKSLLLVNDQNSVTMQHANETRFGTAGTILWAIDENMGTNLQAFLHRLSENTTAIRFSKLNYKKKKKKNLFGQDAV